MRPPAGPLLPAWLCAEVRQVQRAQQRQQRAAEVEDNEPVHTWRRPGHRWDSDDEHPPPHTAPEEVPPPPRAPRASEEHDASRMGTSKVLDLAGWKVVKGMLPAPTISADSEEEEEEEEDEVEQPVLPQQAAQQGIGICKVQDQVGWAAVARLLPAGSALEEGEDDEDEVVQEQEQEQQQGMPAGGAEEECVGDGGDALEPKLALEGTELSAAAPTPGKGGGFFPLMSAAGHAAEGPAARAETGPSKGRITLLSDDLRSFAMQVSHQAGEGPAQGKNA